MWLIVTSSLLIVVVSFPEMPQVAVACVYVHKLPVCRRCLQKYAAGKYPGGYSLFGVDLGGYGWADNAGISIEDP